VFLAAEWLPSIYVDRLGCQLGCQRRGVPSLRLAHNLVYQDFRVEAKGLEPSNLLTASQALYQLSYAPEEPLHSIRPGTGAGSQAR